jgi:hypothetical protein
MKKILFVLAFAAVLGASRPASADILVNGSFETGDFTGWATNGGFLAVSTAGFDGLNPSDGTFFASMGTVGGLGTIAQDFATTAGNTYELTYTLASDGGTPNEFATVVNGNILFDQVNIPQQGMTLYTFDFVATGATSNLTFFEQNDPGFLGLDAVAVRSVPEPSAIALFGVGAIGLVAALRKRRKATV